MSSNTKRNYPLFVISLGSIATPASQANLRTRNKELTTLIGAKR